MPTKIEWAEETWNPITGCSKISGGCQNCYAERMSHRLAGRYGYPKAPNNFRPTFHSDRLAQPSVWKKPRRIFVCSMSDIMHPVVEPLWFALILDQIKKNPHHVFMLLTKRPERMIDDHLHNTMIIPFFDPPMKNLWFGVTVENQRHDNRILDLKDIQADKKFISFEPLIGPFDFLPPWMRCIDWVICGAETGPKKRPMNLDWARSLRDQCLEAGVPFFFKKDSNGNHELDGEIWEQIPK